LPLVLPLVLAMVLELGSSASCGAVERWVLEAFYGFAHGWRASLERGSSGRQVAYGR
jgi:hypothetical protein